jgi:hypothetical protein
MGADPLIQKGNNYSRKPNPQQGGRDNQGTEVGPAAHGKYPHHKKFVRYIRDGNKKQSDKFGMFHLFLLYLIRRAFHNAEEPRRGLIDMSIGIK